MDEKNDIFATSKGKWDFTIAIIVILLFSFFIYQYGFKNKDTTTSEEIKIENSLENVNNDSKSLLLKSYTRTEIEAEDAYDLTISTAVVISDFETSNSITEAPEAFSAQDSTQLTTITTHDKIVIPSEPEIISSEEVTQIIKDSIIPKEENLIKEEVSSNVITNVDTSKKPLLSCAIIVGVFKNPKNKEAIIQELNANGYSHVEGILRKETSYIGVPIECDNETKKQELLNELNTLFNIDSWVKKI